MEVSINGGTPSFHPFIDWISPYKPSSDKGVPPFMETPVYTSISGPCSIAV